MPYNFIADSFHTNKLCSRFSSSEVRFYTKNGRFAFLSLLKERAYGHSTMIVLGSLETRSGLPISVFVPTGAG